MGTLLDKDTWKFIASLVIPTIAVLTSLRVCTPIVDSFLEARYNKIFKDRIKAYNELLKCNQELSDRMNVVELRGDAHTAKINSLDLVTKDIPYLSSVLTDIRNSVDGFNKNFTIRMDTVSNSLSRLEGQWDQFQRTAK